MSAPQLSNYVLETATAPGTGSFTLNGPAADRRSFEAAFSSGALVFYFADDGSSAEWGIGTLTVGTPSVLARTTVLGNTANTRAALNFPGTVEVYNEIPAECHPVLGQDGSLDLAGGLTIKGLPAVVGAISDHSHYVLQVTYDTDAQAFGFLDTTGVWKYVQPQGDYATNGALSAETSRATTIEGNLQTSKANLGGGNTFYGDQTVRGNVSVGVGLGWSGGTASGQRRWSNGHLIFGSPDGATNTYMGAFQITDLMGSPGDNYSGINMFGLDYSGKRYDWQFPWNGNIVTPKGSVAFVSDLDNLATTSQLPSGGTAGNGYYTITAGIQDLVFTITFNTAGGQWVEFPRKFSSTPNVLACSDGSSDNQTDTDWYVWGRTKDGFYFNARNHQGSFQIFAKGPA
ncbi:hypothetical protein AmDm5_0490 [Acetobacter malorum]|uniref:Tail fiber protein n=1 Tax=Acetobacter malorum TaxID=178901 RepID=A0A087PXE6_9PROT|nr:hypothetical protein [Acetobacter malorum]KFL92049.1 hypothetical protein AmDm5_0490 [Acetobacter malorum]OAG78485.1 tail fiber protein [Acetobacter malorum]